MTLINEIVMAVVCFFKYMYTTSQ